MDDVKMSPNYGVRKIFSSEQEKDLVAYLIDCSKMNFGLTPMLVRRLAVEMAEINGITVPTVWKERKMAGKLYCTYTDLAFVFILITMKMIYSHKQNCLINLFLCISG